MIQDKCNQGLFYLIIQFFGYTFYKFYVNIYYYYVIHHADNENLLYFIVVNIKYYFMQTTDTMWDLREKRRHCCTRETKLSLRNI